MSACRSLANIACLLVTHLPVKAERQRYPALRSKPLVVVTRREREDVVLDSSKEARGVAAGMTLEAALERCGESVFMQGDDSFYDDCLDRMEDALAMRCPVVERREMGCLYAHIEGMELAYGGEAQLIASLLQAIPPQFDPRLGLASARFTAYAAASVAPHGRAAKTPSDPVAFLSGLSIELLPISAGVKERLRHWGILTLGHLASMPLGVVQARLGTEGRRAWEFAQGIEPSQVQEISRTAA